MVYRASFGPSSSACFESFVESNRAPRDTPIEGESEENLRWYSLVHKFGYILEPELPVVIRVPDNAASRSIQVLQSKQSFPDQGRANPLPLMRWQHRNGSQSVPVGCTIGNGHGGKRQMPNHAAIQFRDQRYREGLGRAERHNDELLRVVADFQRFERSDRHFGYRVDIRLRLAFDEDPGFHVLCNSLSRIEITAR